jgi:putative ATP-dependent endonuclease of OLD family
LGCHECFWVAYEAFKLGRSVPDVNMLLPSIKIAIEISYEVNSADLGPLSDCIVDLNPNCCAARVVLTYGPQPTAPEALFADHIVAEDATANRLAFFRTMVSRVPSVYSATLEAVDPNDSSNRKLIEHKTLLALVKGSFINAQRGLDDDTYRERDVLGKVVEVLFQSALTDPVDHEKRSTAEQIKVAIEQIQNNLHANFNGKLNSLLPTFELFGYPGLADPGVVTETSFDVDKLLSNHTKVRYFGANGITLPEAYNGLGTRNLVYILLQLFQFFREYQTTPTTAGVHLIFVEEPEAHLHPQMQEVFIRQINQITSVFVTQLNKNRPWPVQFVVTTHSPHMANEANFETIRYFLSVPDGEGMRRSVVKDLRKGMGDAPAPDREFLHQYLTLTRCDLFFADKAILVEGTAERILLQAMIRKTDSSVTGQPQLGNQYLSVMEVGGAYAHTFFDLLSFLELRTLIITDIDAVKPNEGGRHVAVPVAQGLFSSNGCLKYSFGADVSPAALLEKTAAEKTYGIRRIAFQTPEAQDGPCGRTFEDAFILANPLLFDLGDGDHALTAYELAAEQKKSAFALKYAFEHEKWFVPRYIAEGLRWLAEGNTETSEWVPPVMVEIGAEAVGVAMNVAEVDGNG